MRGTDQIQGLRLIKFEDVYGRMYRGELSQLEAAEILGMSERTFRRYRDRFEADGAAGLYDRRLGRVSARRAGVDEVMTDWYWDLIVTMDHATSEIYSAFFVAEEGTMSTLRALAEVIGERGLFCSLYADRVGHYWHTPAAGGKVDKDNPTQVGRALERLGIELIAAYSPEARDRSERVFGTLQKRLPPELRHAGITTMEDANRFLKEVFLPDHNARFAVAPEAVGSAFVPFAGALEDILCVREEHVVGNGNTVLRYRNRRMQIPADRHRHHYIKARVTVHEYADGALAVFHGPRCLTRYREDATPIEDSDRQAAYSHIKG